MYRYFKREKNSNMPKRPPTPFFIFMEVFRKEFNKNNPNNKRVAAAGKAAGERWRALSESDKAPYVLKAQKLKAEYDEKVVAYVRRLVKRVEGGIVYDFDESDMSVADELEFEISKTEKFKIDKVESDIFESVKSESEVDDSQEKKNKIGKINDEKIKRETEEVEFKANLYNHLEKIISLPLETMLQSSHLLQLKNILKQVKALPLVDAELLEWCTTFLEVTTVMPKQRIDIQKMLMEAEAKAQAIVELQKEAAHIRNSSLQDMLLVKEYMTSIERVDEKIENLKRESSEAEAERASLLRLGEGLATAKYRRVKRARMVHDDLALLIEHDAAINKIILDGTSAVKNTDGHLNALIDHFNVLKNACKFM